jgi:hypothetical protein
MTIGLAVEGQAMLGAKVHVSGDRWDCARGGGESQLPGDQYRQNHELDVDALYWCLSSHHEITSLHSH